LIKSIVLIADAYPPSQSSAALQLRDLAEEFLRQGIKPTVLSPGVLQGPPHELEDLDGIQILRLGTFTHKGVGHIRRALAELLMPFIMILRFRASPLKNQRWDAIIWYSPTIFLGPFIFYIKKINPCKSYLILRDIFPAWALDLKLLNKGLAYYFFTLVEYFQYSVADSIGVQSYGNLNYFKKWPSLAHKKIEVLQNWLSSKSASGCSIDIGALSIANRKIFVYAGNMGVAQGMEVLLDLAQASMIRPDIGFLFIGQGSNKEALTSDAISRGLTNVVFADEIKAEEIPGLYAQCHVGLITLDPRHKTHNIPGKFLSYLLAGLPVLAIVNKGNDLELLIEQHGVGKVSFGGNSAALGLLVESIVQEVEENGEELSKRCKHLAQQMFSSETAVNQIVSSLQSLK
jgi:glycosyltransferase involved in cell wall biosynthesis